MGMVEFRCVNELNNWSAPGNSTLAVLTDRYYCLSGLLCILTHTIKQCTSLAFSTYQHSIPSKYMNPLHFTFNATLVIAVNFVSYQQYSNDRRLINLLLFMRHNWTNLHSCAAHFHKCNKEVLNVIGIWGIQIVINVLNIKETLNTFIVSIYKNLSSMYLVENNVSIVSWLDQMKWNVSECLAVFLKLLLCN